MDTKQPMTDANTAAGAAKSASSPVTGYTTAPRWGAEKRETDTVDVLYPGWSEWHDGRIQVRAGIDIETAERLYRELGRALGYTVADQREAAGQPRVAASSTQDNR